MPHDFDPETARLASLSALRAWARQRDRMPEQRAALLVASWSVGERNVRELARIADVSRQTVYDDLRAAGIDPSTTRTAAAVPPRYHPLVHDDVEDLAAQMATVLAPAMLSGDPEPMAMAAWMAHKTLTAIAHLLDPATTDADAGDWYDTIAHCADAIRRAAHRQWALDATGAELAKATEDDAVNRAELGEAALVTGATVTLASAASRKKVTVTLSTAEFGGPEPDGWTTWTSDGTAPIGPVDGFAHLEIRALLAGLSAVITPAVDPAELDLPDE